MPRLYIKAKGIRFQELNRFIRQFAQHEETVIDILVDFFGVNVQKYSIEALQRFILGAFQIQSTNTSVRSIAADAEFIRRTVYYRADGLRKAGK